MPAAPWPGSTSRAHAGAVLRPVDGWLWLDPGRRGRPAPVLPKLGDAEGLEAALQSALESAGVSAAVWLDPAGRRLRHGGGWEAL